ncbi:MAG TPA: EamA family transporter, partial [Candidatus Sabulitectum sp.]|nr:EamA family transporter [Candidatus Sabulitectum sp.]
IGVFEMGITYIMWNTALKKAESTASVGGLIFLTPFLALIPIALIVGEGIAPSTITGLVLVTAGILLEKRFRHRAERLGD